MATLTLPLAPRQSRALALALLALAVLLGAALLGIIGALVAIPVAASVRLLLQEVTFHRMDQS